MVKVKVKGYEFELKPVTSGYDRRAVQYANNIIESLKKIGIIADDVDVPVNVLGNKNIAGFALWYFDGYKLQYRYSGCKRFIDNLQIISKVIELEINEILKGNKTIANFIYDYTEEKDVKESRNDAREILGLDEKENDLEVINQKYKKLAKQYHPDMPDGNLEKFQALNKAHKLIKKELG